MAEDKVRELYNNICVAIGIIDLRDHREFRDVHSAQLDVMVRRALFTPDNDHMQMVAEGWRKSARGVISTLISAAALRDEFKGIEELCVTRAQYFHRSATVMDKT